MKKYVMVAAPFFLLALVIGISVTYALFESSKKVDTEIDIAKWQVKINDNQINGFNSSFVVNKVNWETSPYVKEGLAAPGLSGSFDIEINPNNTETSIRYDVLFNFSELNSKQFVIDEIKEVNSNNIVRTGKYMYSNIMTLDEINRNITNTIRVYITWINDEQNNKIDSNLGKVLNSKLQIPVLVTITQHEEGEGLVEYIEP